MEERTMAKIYAVTGATGHVGKVVAQKLESQGAGVDIYDAPALAPGI